MSSIRAGKRPVEVVFDPRRLPRSGRGAVVRFADPRSVSAVVYPLFQENAEEDSRLSRAYQAHVAAGGDRDSFRWDRSAYAGRLERRLRAEPDSLRRQFLLFSLLQYPGPRPDSTLALRSLREIPPDSPLWSLAPLGPTGPLSTVWRATGRPSAIREYAERGSERHADREIRAGFLSMAIHEADDAGDKDRLGRYVSRMIDEFAGTQSLEMARARYAPDRAIRVGQPAPDVGFSALDDSSQAIRVSDFRGRHVLVDFWAVWCGPCRAEMPRLHRAWEAFKDRGLTVLSVSFDRTRDEVARYRREKWAMPWRHAFAAEGFAGREAGAYQVWAIPKAVLIGPDGMIVAADDELRGEKLHDTLSRALGEPKDGSGGRK